MRLSAELRAYYEAKAKRENRTLSNVIETALIQQMEADRKARKPRT